MVAGVLASSAQVYSANVVGYVSKTFTASAYTLVCTPLDAGTNDLQTVFPSPPDGTTVQIWDIAAQDFSGTTPQYDAGQKKWIPNATVAPGLGYFVVAGADFTNTFVGNVLQGSLTNSIVGGSAYQAIGSMVPVGGSLTNVLAGYQATDGDTVQMWDVATQDFSGTTPQYDALQSKWIPDTSVPVGDGFFLVRTGGDTKYVRNFTVQ